MKSRYTKATFLKQDKDFRIGAIISDGQWYTSMKWRKLAGVTEDEIEEWIHQNLESGRLIQAEAKTKSYRFSLESVREWYKENNIPEGEQLVDFIFPPRVWDGMTETEGFLKNPRREIGTVQFECSHEVKKDIARSLEGIARIREEFPGKYKAYCLNPAYVKSIIEKVVEKHDEASVGVIRARVSVYRREIVDFSPKFREGIVSFYKVFAKTLVKGAMETIKIFLPAPEDQESQMIVWVITAIEKFDQNANVPFSGYLSGSLPRWPYDLPNDFLGKDLSDFQRQKSQTLKKLAADANGEQKTYSSTELAEAMGISVEHYNEMEESNAAWMKSKTATSLTWDENSDEKMSSNVSGNLQIAGNNETDIELAHKLSLAIIHASLNSGAYDTGFFLMSQMDSSEINFEGIKEMSPKFVHALGVELGML